MAQDAQKKTGTINGRISGELRARLDAIYARHAVGDSEMLQDALTALADYVESMGRYLRPVVMNYDDSAANLHVAEDQEPGAAPRAKKKRQKPGGSTGPVSALSHSKPVADERGTASA